MKKILIIIAMFLFVGCISSTYNISQLPIEKIKTANKTSVYWSVLHYVDEFRQRTNQKYLSASIYDGKFSNSAVKDRELNVDFIIDTNSVSFKFSSTSIKLSICKDVINSEFSSSEINLVPLFSRLTT